MFRPIPYALFAVILAVVLGCNAPVEQRVDPIDTITNVGQDTAYVLLNSADDTILTGVALPLKGRAIAPDSIKPPTVTHVGAPNIKPYPRAGQLIGTAAKVTHSVVGTLVVNPAQPFDTVVAGTRVVAQSSKPTEAIEPRYKDDAVLNIRYLETDQGLISQYVYSVMEDSRGHLWFGTYDGLCRYDGRIFQNYTTKEGLINHEVLALLEDRAGNIWIGTQGGGVSRFDGVHFTHFQPEDGIGNRVVRTIFEDLAGHIWFGTDGAGAVEYDGSTLKRYDTSSGLAGNRVWGIVQDFKGAMWFASVDGGITRLEGKQFTHFTANNGLPSPKVRTLAVDRNGHIWAGTHGGGLVHYNGIDLTTYTHADGLSLDLISDILVDEDNSLWVATAGAGAMHLQPELDSLNQTTGLVATYITETDGLSNNRVSNIYKDTGGNIWLATEGGGVNRFTSGSFTHMSTADGLCNNYVYGLTDDRKGNIWITTDGGGVDRFDGKTFTNYSTAQGLALANVWSVLCDSKGNTWFGTYGGGVGKFDGLNMTTYTKASGLSDDYVVCVVEDHSGNIWFGTNGGGICRLDSTGFTHFGEAEGLSSNVIRGLMVDSRGRLWIGTNGGGACMYDGKTFTHFSPKEGLIGSSVLSIYESADGALWFGTGEGISRYYNGRFINLNESHGLANNKVWSVAQGPDGSMWFGTLHGLSRLNAPNGSAFDLGKVRMRNYLKEDGLHSNDFALNAVLRDARGRMWWGTGTVLTMLAPDAAPQTDIGPMAMQDRIEIDQRHIDFRLLADPSGTTDSLSALTGINLSGAELGKTVPYFNFPSIISLPNRLNNITFHFTAVDWIAPHKIRYQYRLDGEDWGPASVENKAVFSNMPVGEHLFEVRARGHNGQWGPPFQYALEVRPPWWLTWWAFGLIGLAAVGFVMLIFRWRTASLIARQNELTQTVAERTYNLEQEKSAVIRQKDQLEKQNHEILQSIDYAKRLQEAVLPANDTLGRLFADSFLLYMPRDIVSGDFYWAEEHEGHRYFAVADCTGHGVPGAMLSIIGLNGLHRSLNVMGTTEPKDFLTQLTQEIQTTFTSTGTTTVRDGMDIGLCRINADSSELIFSGANIPLWVIRNNEIIEVTPDRRPIGYFELEKPFTQTTVPLQKGDTIYLFSDGYTSQQGGDLGKKLMRGQFRNLLLGLCHLPLDRQSERLSEFLIAWQRDYEQTDDICILAIRY